MNVDALWDSIKVRSELDAFAAAWRKRGSTDEERKHRLAALVGVLFPQVMKASDEDRKEKLAGIERHNDMKLAILKEMEKREALANMETNDDRPFTPAELAAERANDAANAPMPIGQVMEAVYNALVRPQVRTGRVKLPFEYGGMAVPMGEWKEFLETKGVYCRELETHIDNASRTFTMHLM